MHDAGKRTRETHDNLVILEGRHGGAMGVCTYVQAPAWVRAPSLPPADSATNGASPTSASQTRAGAGTLHDLAPAPPHAHANSPSLSPMRSRSFQRAHATARHGIPVSTAIF